MADSSGKKDQPSSQPPADKVVKLNTHPLVSKLLPPGGSPPTLAQLTGYIGPSQKPDSVRLYTGLDFNSYYEIPKSAIVHTEQTDAEDENSPTGVYVKADAAIDVVQTTTQSVEASFLQGAITSANLANAAASTAVGAAALQPTPTAIPTFICTFPPQCPHTLPRPVCTEVISACGICPTRTVIHSACLPCVTIPAGCTHLFGCLTSPIICSETCVPSRIIIHCPTSPIICSETCVPSRLVVQCPSSPIICPIPVNSVACTGPPGGGGAPAR
jgi:hypothetical protein